MQEQQGDTLKLLDSRNRKWVVRKTDATCVIKKQACANQRMDQDSLVVGLDMEVVGSPGGKDEVIAEVITFTVQAYIIAKAIEARFTPLEERTSNVESKMTTTEENTQRLSGQLEELAAVSNAARGGGKVAQATADAAVAGVNATNDRIAATDDYIVERTITIQFPVKSAVIPEQAKAQLQVLGPVFSQMRGYFVEVAGFGDQTGTNEENTAISQARADAVARYLATSGLVPVRRLLLPLGYGTGKSAQLIGRVEIRVLINKGLTAPAPTMTPPQP